MKKLPSILVLLICAVIASAQNLHRPEEILKIMESSDLTYNMEILSNQIPCPDRSEIVNSNDFYRVVTNSSITTYSYHIKPAALPFLEKAEIYFMSNIMDSARIYYEKVLEKDPSYFKVMTYLGQLHGTARNFDQALEWYNKAINNNYIDYMAHWFIADIYKEQGEIDKAVNEITIASILNRNNPRIKASMSDIYNLSKIKTEDWCFVPQCEISKEDTGVKIAFNNYWVGYAMAKALWKYEPGYKQSMGVKEDVYSSLEDKECLLNLMTGLLNAKKNLKKYPELTTLKSAIEKDYLNEFIFYEIVLPEHPNVAYQLTEEFISRIREYVLKIRYETQIKSEPELRKQTGKYKFDLSFINEEPRKTFVDSLGYIHFSDTILEKRIKHALKLDFSKFISINALDTVKTLNLSGKVSDKFSEQIKSLDGLQYFKGLKFLNLSFNSIKSLSPLQNIVGLQRLIAQNCQIDDITPLKGLYLLTELSLYMNNVKDISPLSHLTNMVNLNLWDNKVSDIGALSNMINLRVINLGRNQIMDISPLVSCRKLYDIWIPYNPISNPEILSGFNETLKVLSLAYCNITNLEYLENCSELEDLVIFNNRIKDISVIHKMTKLKTLLASNNQIDNIDVIPFLIKQGAFQEKSRFDRNGGNLDLSNNPVNFGIEENGQIKAFIEKNVRVVKF